MLKTNKKKKKKENKEINETYFLSGWWIYITFCWFKKKKCEVKIIRTISSYLFIKYFKWDWINRTQTCFFVFFTLIQLQLTVKLTPKFMAVTN